MDGFIQHYVHTCGSCNTVYTHALQAPLRVNPYERKDSNKKRELRLSPEISQRLFLVMKSPGISKFCFSTKVVSEKRKPLIFSTQKNFQNLDA